MTENIQFDKFVLFNKFNVNRITVDNLMYINIHDFIFVVNQNTPKFQPFTQKLKRMLLSSSRLNEHGIVDIFVPKEFILSYNRIHSVNFKQYILITSAIIEKCKVSREFKGVYIPICIIKPSYQWLNVMRFKFQMDSTKNIPKCSRNTLKYQRSLDYSQPSVPKQKLDVKTDLVNGIEYPSL